MEFPEQKAEELRQKFAAFGSAVDAWLMARRGPAAFRIHQSQLAAVESILKGVRKAIERALAPAPDAAPLLSRAEGIEEMILSGYQIWEFYRPKFAQRLETQFQKHLRIADEFAWSCYMPVRDAVFGAGVGAKEPPLVYLNAGWSPFVKERNREYQVESVPRALLRSVADFGKALAQLPFPVIGVPWYQAGFLPGALTVAHEVGHAVESDCGLTEALAEALAGATSDAGRKNDWLSWASEIFADGYGCLCAGPAFVWSLANTLASDGTTVNSARDAGYPPRSLRILLNCTMLEQLGHKTAAAKLREHWTRQYPEAPSWSAYRQDLNQVARALLNVPVTRARDRPAPVSRLVEFSPKFDKDARQFAADTLAGDDAQRDNMRVSFAAVQHAYGMDPLKYASCAQRFVDRLWKSCPDDIRHGEVNAPQGRAEMLSKLGQVWVT
jgi:hypothetical protein